jgi:hypothetical protein
MADQSIRRTCLGLPGTPCGHDEATHFHERSDVLEELDGVAAEFVTKTVALTCLANGCLCKKYRGP